MTNNHLYFHILILTSALLICVFIFVQDIKGTQENKFKNISLTVSINRLYVECFKKD